MTKSELLAQAEALEQSRCVQSQETAAELRAQAAAAEAQEPVAWTTELAIECSVHALAFEVCAGNLWGERGVPLFRRPDPRIALLEGLIGEALDTCHLGDDAGLHKRMRDALGLKP